MKALICIVILISIASLVTCYLKIVSSSIQPAPGSLSYSYGGIQYIYVEFQNTAGPIDYTTQVAVFDIIAQSSPSLIEFGSQPYAIEIDMGQVTSVPGVKTHVGFYMGNTGSNGYVNFVINYRNTWNNGAVIPYTIQYTYTGDDGLTYTDSSISYNVVLPPPPAPYHVYTILYEDISKYGLVSIGPSTKFQARFQLGVAKFQGYDSTPEQTDTFSGYDSSQGYQVLQPGTSTQVTLNSPNQGDPPLFNSYTDTQGSGYQGFDFQPNYVDGLAHTITFSVTDRDVANPTYNIIVATCFGLSGASACSGVGMCTGIDTCTCDYGYGGNQCQYFTCGGLLSTDPTVCYSHGSCTGIDTCTCNSGYVGTCQYATCNGITGDDPSVCNGHGTCSSPNVCTCNNGYGGTVCDEYACGGFLASDPNVCSGHGDCIAPGYTAVVDGVTTYVEGCTCESGYGRDYYLSEPNRCEAMCFGMYGNDYHICNRQGSCVAPDTCVCGNNYGGADCTIAPCYGKAASDPTVCNGGGTCVGLDTCQCDAYHSGTQCDISICNGILATNSSVCNGRGTCIGTDTCDCTSSGYTGNDCQFPICYSKSSNDSSVCSGNGTCIAPNACDCKSGFGNIDCSSWTCFGIAKENPLVCSTYGTCVDHDKCMCEESYSGSNCEIWSCNGLLRNDTQVCSTNGTCVGTDMCSCDTGFNGTNCETWGCYGMSMNDELVCNKPNGTCVAPDNCYCTVGYYGEVCQRYQCNGIEHYDLESCSYNGLCIAPEECVCKPGFVGEACEFFTCYGKLANDSLSCSGNGTCVALNTCMCKPGYYGENCQYWNCYGYRSDTDGLCSGNGWCVAPKQCACELGWTGSICEERVADPSIHRLTSEEETGRYVIATTILVGITVVPILISVYVLKTLGIISFDKGPILSKIK